MQPLGRDRRQVLQAVNGEICATVEDRRLHFAGEDSLAPHLAEGRESVPVARGADLDNFDHDARLRGTDQIGDMPSLPHGQLTGSRGNAEGS